MQALKVVTIPGSSFALFYQAVIISGSFDTKSEYKMPATKGILVRRDAVDDAHEATSKTRSDAPPISHIRFETDKPQALNKGLSKFIESSTIKRVRSLPKRTLSGDTSLLTEATEDTHIIKTVRFSKQAVLRRKMPLSHYTKNEINKCWFSKTEYKMITENSLRQLKLMERDDDRMRTKPHKYCGRGLEHQTKDGRKRRMKNREDSVNAVFDELERQVDKGIVDEIAIAGAYRKKAYGSQLWARVIGMRDYREAYGSDDDDNIFAKTGDDVV